MQSSHDLRKCRQLVCPFAGLSFAALSEDHCVKGDLFCLTLPLNLDKTICCLIFSSGRWVSPMETVQLCLTSPPLLHISLKLHLSGTVFPNTFSFFDIGDRECHLNPTQYTSQNVLPPNLFVPTAEIMES